MSSISINNEEPFAHVIDSKIPNGLLGVILVIPKYLINSEVSIDDIVFDLS